MDWVVREEKGKFVGRIRMCMHVRLGGLAQTKKSMCTGPNKKH